MVEAMRKEVDDKQMLNSEGSLFPDLAPYGQYRPPVKIKPKDEPAPKRPLPPRQPNITEKPLNINSSGPQRPSRRAYYVDDASELKIGTNQSQPDMLTNDISNVKRVNSHYKLYIILAATFVMLSIISASLFVLRPKTNTPVAVSSNQSSNATANTVTPPYYPKDLPTGYSYNDDVKVLQNDVFYFSVTGPRKEVYYMTEKPAPENFDFVAYSKKFVKPNIFSNSVGMAVIGFVGDSVRGTLKTNDNILIVINPISGGTIAQVEAVIRSFRPK